MAMPDISTVYDLGQHVVEISNEGMMLITNVPDDTAPLKEGAQLDNNEVYRLFTVLQEWFGEERHENGEEGCERHAVS